MSGNRLRRYPSQIHRAATDACSFIDGMSKEDFLSDRRTQNAVVMSLIIVGEAAAKIMDRHPDFAELRTDIPWREMRGMRNRIAHGYFEIDLNVVWDTAGTALPALPAQFPVTYNEANGEGMDSGVDNI